MEEVVKYVGSAESDVEVTSPFEFLSNFTDEVNYVRTSLLIANDFLYRGENKTEYFSGVELMALFRRGSQVAWAHVGAPSLLIQRKHQSLQPLSIGTDLSSELRNAEQVLPPLPSRLLGLEPSATFSAVTRISSEDQLVLIAGTSIASSLWIKDSYTTDLGSITDRMIQENPEAPFWLGLVNLDSES